jgi:hypothetical protein
VFEHIIIDYAPYEAATQRREMSASELEEERQRRAKWPLTDPSLADTSEDAIVSYSSTPDPRQLDDVDDREMRLYPFLYLIADQVSEVGGNFVNGRSGANFVSRGADITDPERPNWIDRTINQEASFFSASKSRKRHAMLCGGLSSQTAVLLLAAAGLDITVPGFTIDLARTEEVAHVREKLTEERARYRIALTRMADEAMARLSAKVYRDTVDWALNEANLKIRPKAEEFHLAMSRLNRPLLQRMGADFLTDGLPAVGSSLLSDGASSATKKFIEILLTVLCKNLSRSIEERRVPEVVYGYKVRSELDSMLKDNEA